MTTKTRQRLALSEALFTRCYATSRQWNKEVAENIMLHGDVGGTHTSGVYNPAWPDAVKNRLRAIASGVTRLSNAAWAARPKRVRFQTMLKLKQFVVKRDGKGYYG